MQGLATELPLARWPALRTRDPARAREHLSSLFRPHQIRLGKRPAAIDFRHHRADLGGVSLNALRYGTEVTVDAPTLADSYLVKFTRHGASEVRQGSVAYQTTTSSLCVLNPTRALLDRMSADFDMLVLQIDGGLLRRALAEDFGVSLRQPLEFAPAAHRLTAQISSFERMVRTLLADFDAAAGGLQQPAMRRPLVRTLASLLLTGVPHNYSAWLDRDQQASLPRHVRAVEQFVEVHFAEAIGLDDLLLAAGTSARTLQAGFLRHKGTTPMRYLRDRRLDRARAELKRHPGARITDVALQCGFTHFGKFAQYYKERFGEVPSTTRVA